MASEPLWLAEFLHTVAVVAVEVIAKEDTKRAVPE